MLASWLEYMDLNFSDKVEASFNSSCHECWCKLTNLLQEHFNICLSKVLLLVPLDVLPTPAVQKLSDQVAPWNPHNISLFVFFILDVSSVLI